MSPDSPARLEDSSRQEHGDDLNEDADDGHSLVTRPSRPLKRAHSPGSSARNMTDLSSARQLCMDGKMYELIDLSNDEVWPPISVSVVLFSYVLSNLNRKKFRSEHYFISKPKSNVLLALHISYTMCLVRPSPIGQVFT
jgi:hypothetical protein